jgi:hypothetical protein
MKDRNANDLEIHLAELNSQIRNKMIRTALQSIFSKEMRDIGFEGRLPWYRRLGTNGIEILHVQFEKGRYRFRLDAGKIPLRAKLTAKSPQQDYGLFTSSSHRIGNRSLLIKVAKHRPGADWFFYDSGTTPTYFNSVAKSAADIAISEGTKFWRRKL